MAGAAQLMGLLPPVAPVTVAGQLLRPVAPVGVLPRVPPVAPVAVLPPVAPVGVLPRVAPVAATSQGSLSGVKRGRPEVDTGTSTATTAAPVTATTAAPVTAVGVTAAARPSDGSNAAGLESRLAASRAHVGSYVHGVAGSLPVAPAVLPFTPGVTPTAGSRSPRLPRAGTATAAAAAAATSSSNSMEYALAALRPLPRQQGAPAPPAPTPAVIAAFMAARGLTDAMLAAILGVRERMLAAWMRNPAPPSLLAPASATRLAVMEALTAARNKALAANPALTPADLTALEATTMRQVRESMGLQAVDVLVSAPPTAAAGIGAEGGPAAPAGAAPAPASPSAPPGAAPAAAAAAAAAPAAPTTAPANATRTVRLLVTVKAYQQYVRARDERLALLAGLAALLAEEAAMVAWEALPPAARAPSTAATAVGGAPRVVGYDSWGQATLEDGTVLRWDAPGAGGGSDTTGGGSGSSSSSGGTSAAFMRAVYFALQREYAAMSTADGVGAGRRVRRPPFIPRKATPRHRELEASAIVAALTAAPPTAARASQYLWELPSVPTAATSAPVLTVTLPQQSSPPLPPTTATASSSSTGPLPPTPAALALLFNGHEVGFLAAAGLHYRASRAFARLMQCISYVNVPWPELHDAGDRALVITFYVMTALAEQVEAPPSAAVAAADATIEGELLHMALLCLEVWGAIFRRAAQLAYEAVRATEARLLTAVAGRMAAATATVAITPPLSTALLRDTASHVAQVQTRATCLQSLGWHAAAYFTGADDGAVGASLGACLLSRRAEVWAALQRTLALTPSPRVLPSAAGEAAS